MTEWPLEEDLKLHAAVSHLETAASHLDPLMGLMAISTMADVIPDLAAELCKIASRDGYTNKRIANALGVAPATLRGLKEEARA
jgi:hypothetical protein